MLIGKKITELDLLFVKEYLKVDFSDDDNLISMIVIAAQSYIQTMLGFKFSSYISKNIEIPDELTIACLMIIAHWYDQRQVQTVGTLGEEIKFAVSALVDAHKDHMKLYVEEEDLTHFN